MADREVDDVIDELQETNVDDLPMADGDETDSEISEEIVSIREDDRNSFTSDVDHQSTPVSVTEPSTALTVCGTDDRVESPFVPEELPPPSQESTQSASKSPRPQPPSYTEAVRRSQAIKQNARTGTTALPPLRNAPRLPGGGEVELVGYRRRRSFDAEADATAETPFLTTAAASSSTSSAAGHGDVEMSAGGSLTPPPAYHEIIGETTFIEQSPSSDDEGSPAPSYREDDGEAVSVTEDRPSAAVEEETNSTASNRLLNWWQSCAQRCRPAPLGLKTRRNVIIACVVLSCAAMFVILFPFQFSYVDYYQYAFKRTKSTRRVDTDKVFEHGCYLLGADTEFVYFDRTIQSIDFKNVSLFTADNVHVYVDVGVFYTLRYDGARRLWDDFAGEYMEVVEAVVLTNIKNTGPRVKQEDFLMDRENTEALFQKAVQDRFSDWGIDVDMLVLYQVSLPERILQKKLKALVIQIQIEKELYYQKQREVELQTDLLTIPLEYGAKETVNNATAEAAAIKSIAQTSKEQVVDVSHSQAFTSMMDVLNVNRSDHALSFYYLATLNTMSNFGGMVDYTKNGFYHPG